MKLTDLKIGDQVTTYSSGELVTGKVVSIKDKCVTIKHPPVRWGRDSFTETMIKPSTKMQFKHSQTTPKAWYNNTEITIEEKDAIDSFLFIH